MRAFTLSDKEFDSLHDKALESLRTQDPKVPLPILVYPSSLKAGPRDYDTAAKSQGERFGAPRIVGIALGIMSMIWGAYLVSVRSVLLVDGFVFCPPVSGLLSEARRAS